MTTYSTTIAPTMTTDAEFRTLVAAIRTGIESVITRAGDSGQIDTTTVTRPGSNNTAAGYNIYRLPGGTQDVYLKIEYGRGTSLTELGIWTTFGTATDGAGTLSGAMCARRQWTTFGSVASTTAYNCYFSGGTGRFAMALFDNHPTNNAKFILSMERDWDASGTANEAYYYAIYATRPNVNSNLFNRCVKVSGDVWFEMGVINSTAPNDRSTCVLGLDIAAYPVRPIYGTERNASKNWIIIPNTDVAVGTVFNSDLYSTTMTWVRLIFPPSGDTGSSGVHSFAMRWE